MKREITSGKTGWRAAHGAALWASLAIWRVAVFILIFSITWGRAGNIFAEEGGLDRVSIGTLPVLSSAGFFIAKEKGYFAEQGIDAEIRLFEPSANPPLMMYVRTAELDVGGGVLTASFYNFISKNGGMKLVADKGHDLFDIVVSKELCNGTLSKEILVGQHFAVVEGSAQGIMTELFLKKYDLTLDDIKMVPKPFSEINSAMENGLLLAAAQIEPFRSLAVKDNIVVEVMNGRELYPGQQSAAVFYSEDFIENRKEIAVKFMAGYIKGVRYIEDYLNGKVDGKEFFEMIGKYVPLDDFELFKKMKIPGLNPDGYLDVDSIQKDLRWYHDKGYMNTLPEISGIVDHEFVEKALAEILKTE